MARIEFNDIGHNYAGPSEDTEAYALKPMQHVWQDGGAYALLGPSGCGKTTLLNVISGLIIPTQGQVLFDGQDVTSLPTEQRNIAQVFQFPVIYDTMTVYDNLAFPLRNRGVAAADVDAQVRTVADMLDLSSELNRRARNLSADAKQKISLGRGLVRSDVAAILFDEPLTVIDPHLKWHLRRKLKEIHDRYKLTLVYVTHDQNEALTFADQIVVMHDGRILQVGAPQDLFERPRHTFVGYFIGSPGMNLLDCELEGEAALIKGGRIPLVGAAAARAHHAENGGRLQIGARPEFLALAEAPGQGRVPGAVRAVEDLGNYKIVSVAIGDSMIKVKIDEDTPVPSETAFVVFPGERTLLYRNGELVN